MSDTVNTITAPFKHSLTGNVFRYLINTTWTYSELCANMEQPIMNNFGLRYGEYDITWHNPDELKADKEILYERYINLKLGGFVIVPRN